MIMAEMIILIDDDEWGDGYSIDDGKDNGNWTYLD